MPIIAGAVELIVPPLELSAELSSQLRRADDHIRIGVSAAEQVFSGNETKEMTGGKTGVLVSSAFGPMQSSFDVLAMIADENQTSPTLFTHSVFNSLAGYISRLFNCPGPNYALSDFSWPFFLALAQGWDLFMSGTMEQCLVVQVESYSELLHDVRKEAGYGEEWPQGAVAWLLTTQPRKGWRLERPVVSSVPALPESYLARQELLCWNGQSAESRTPLAAAARVTRLLSQASGETTVDFFLAAPYGEVSLNLFSR